MGKIKVMSDSLANKIAAGEVVEKCVSVVKELVENSVDAGATEIKIEVKESGIKMIKVTDNGVGMDRDDAKVAFLRHATSKIYDELSLFRISSLGFRGEALASIAAVSKVDLKTSTGDVGVHIVLEDGKIIKEEPSDARKGTEITISNLFYNTPARLKYLNSLYTELANICDYVNKMALSYTNIKFSLISDDKKLLSTDGSGNLLKVIKDIYGTNVAKKMRKIEVYNDDYDIDGFISLPEVTRANRNNMITLVNKRVIKNTELNKYINEAYHTYKFDNRYPIVVLNINSDPSLVDVNVHPSKQDVKFSNFSDLKDLIYKGIRKILEDNMLIPSIEDDKKETQKRKIEEQRLNLERTEVISSPIIDYSLFNNDETLLNEDLIISENEEEYNQNKYLSESLKQEENEKASIMPEMYPVGLVRGTYIICHNELGMYIIDQHAAKERINFEYYKEVFANPKREKISMLVPINLEYPNNEFIIINKNIDVLRNLGFNIEEGGINSFIIKEIPIWIKEGYEVDMIKNIIDVLISEESNFDLGRFREHAAATLSCKKAIKANMNISMKEMESLIDDLRKCKNPYNCPHGRPTTIFYSNYELEKLFKRSV